VVYFGVTAYNIAKVQKVKLKRRFPSLSLITINKIGGHVRDIDGFIRGHKGDIIFLHKKRLKWKYFSLKNPI
jgi:hypothetical protein